MASIKDVAKAAGVSTATVSRVLSNLEVVRPATRDKVMDAVRRLDYQPNMLARQLRTQTTRMIIVIVPTIQNSFIQGVIEGIGREAEQNSYQMLIADLNSQPSLELHYYEALMQRQIDGVISLSANMAEKLLSRMAEKRPLVSAVQYSDSASVPCVSIDNIAGAKAATTHLIRLGHTKIAHITADTTTQPYHDRLNGYLQALKDHGLPSEKGLISSGEQSIASGYEQMRSFINRDIEVTAVVASGDTLAIGAIRALKDLGLRVPQDVAVVGFDDIDLSSFFEPALTTIRQPRELIGRTAFQKLLALMQGESVSNGRDLLPYELIIRESCGYFL